MAFGLASQAQANQNRSEKNRSLFDKNCASFIVLILKYNEPRDFFQYSVLAIQKRNKKLNKRKRERNHVMYRKITCYEHFYSICHNAFKGVCIVG